MKNFFSLILLLCAPAFLFAQQKSSTEQQQQQLLKEMDALRAQMQGQIQSLQDSLTKLQQQLAEDQRGNNYPFFKYEAPNNGDYFLSMPDSFDWDHSFNFPCPEGQEFFPNGFNLVIPSVPDLPQVAPFEYHYDMPDIQFYKSMPYEYHFNMPPIPELPQSPDFYREKKHRHDDLWHSLPFYDWFKS